MQQTDPALVAALHRADATGNVAELHPSRVWPRVVRGKDPLAARPVGTVRVRDHSEDLPGPDSYAYTEWDLVRRSRAALFLGGIVGFCIGSALATFACWAVGGFAG